MDLALKTRRAAKADSLNKQGMKWTAIKKKLDAETSIYRSVGAYQGLVTRWRKRQTEICT